MVGGTLVVDGDGRVEFYATRVFIVPRLAAADANAIDAALRLIDREVWVVTAAAGQRRGGLVATWVSAAAIDRERPVLMAGIAPNHFTAELIDASGAFAAHLLRADQIELAWNFAKDSGRTRDKLADLPTNDSAGPPVLADCLAWFDCRVFARHAAGDRLFYWADVIAVWSAKLAGTENATAIPLREHALIRGLSDEQRRRLAEDRAADVAVQRPLLERWRAAANLWTPTQSYVPAKFME
jgi:flavin reductase (DIM6/NTAB) family NADH-FMN oxidoreductase RutF